MVDDKCPTQTTGNSSSAKKATKAPKQRGQNKQGSKPNRNTNNRRGRQEARIRKAQSRPMFQTQVSSFAAAKKACQDAIEGYLLGEKVMAKGFVYHRDDQRPVFQKLFPFQKTISSRYFDNDKGLAFNVHPNPWKTVENVIPPQGGNRAKDISETITIQTHAPNPLYWCFDHDITCVTGSVKASNHVVSGLPAMKHYSASTEEFKDGNKVYVTGPSTFPIEPSVTITNTATYQIQVVAQFTAVLRQGDGLQMGAVAAETFTVPALGLATTNIATNFNQFQTEMASADAFGFVVSFVCSSEDGDSLTLTGSDYSINLSQGSNDPGKFPEFGSAYVLETQTVFEIIGNPAIGLKGELELADGVAVTAYALLLTNYTAQLNRAGRVFGAEVPANHTKAVPLNPEARLASLFSFPSSIYKMREPITVDKGVHFSNIATRDHAEFLPPSEYMNPDMSVYNRPYACVVVDGKGAFDPDSIPDLQLCGWLNVEWRSTSMTFNPIQPPPNIGLFADVLSSVLARLPSGSLWGENPAHLKKIKKLAADVVNSDRFKTVIRDVALVGIESLAAVFI